MATKNPRYVVTVNDEIAAFINRESKSTKASISSIIKNLIEEAIDLREDYELSQIAEESEKRCEGLPTIPASEVWKQCGLL